MIYNFYFLYNKPLYSHYYEKMIVEELFAWNPVRKDLFLFHYHGDNFFGNVLNDLKAKREKISFVFEEVKKIVT